MRSARLSQSVTSRPQLPKRGLTTTGGSIGEIAGGAIMCAVRGCGRLAAWRMREVCSLSCVARSVRNLFRTWTPSASSRPTSQIPGSIPSRLGRTSSRASAASPGPSRPSVPSAGRSRTRRRAGPARRASGSSRCDGVRRGRRAFRTVCVLGRLKRILNQILSTSLQDLLRDGFVLAGALRACSPRRSASGGMYEPARDGRSCREACVRTHPRFGPDGLRAYPTVSGAIRPG